MLKLSLNEMTTYRWSFEDDVFHCAAAGIPAIGVWRQKLSDFGEQRGRELLEDRRLAVSSLLWAGGFTGSDGRTYRESTDDAREAIQLAASLGSRTLVVYSGARAGHTHNHARRLLRAALDELLPVAEQHEVALALEPMHPGCAAEWTFLTSLDETLELIQAARSPWLKLTFDTYHLAHDPSRLLERIPEFVPHIGIVQLGDARRPPDGEQDRCRLGEGTLPLADIVARLVAAGYDGFYDIELMGEEIEAVDDYDELIVQSRGAVERMLAPPRPVQQRQGKGEGFVR